VRNATQMEKERCIASEVSEKGLINRAKPCKMNSGYYNRVNERKSLNRNLFFTFVWL